MIITFCVYSINSNRLDKYISNILNISRRKINFLFSQKKILLNNKIAKKSNSVKIKDLIQIEIFKEEYFEYPELKVIKDTENYLIIFKPEKVHSQELFKSKKSVENFLKNNFGSNVKLLNRLDYNSQGLILAAKSYEFYKRYREYERKKEIEKFYLAFVKGKILKKIIINNEIDFNKRKKVKVVEKKSNIIQTEIIPIAVYENFTIIVAKIFKGARHQIRAHLSYIGHPLIGDAIYGNYKKDNFFLFCFGYMSKKLNFEIFDYKLLKEKAKKYIINLLNF